MPSTSTSIRIANDTLKRADKLIPHVRSLGRYSSTSRSSVLREALLIGFSVLEARRDRAARKCAQAALSRAKATAAGPVNDEERAYVARLAKGADVATRLKFYREERAKQRKGANR